MAKYYLVAERLFQEMAAAVPPSPRRIGDIKRIVLIRVCNADVFIQNIYNAPVFSSNTMKALKRQK